jgi:hypothetical protein
MSFADPQTITVNAVAIPMARVSGPIGSSGNIRTNYQKSDRTFLLDVLHRTVKRAGKTRLISQVAFVKRAIVTDPISSVVDWDSATFSIQFDRPEAGFTATELDQMWTGFKSWFDGAKLTALSGGES